MDRATGFYADKVMEFAFIIDGTDRLAFESYSYLNSGTRQLKCHVMHLCPPHTNYNIIIRLWYFITVYSSLYKYRYYLFPHLLTSWRFNHGWGFSAPRIESLTSMDWR